MRRRILVLIVIFISVCGLLFAGGVDPPTANDLGKYQKSYQPATSIMPFEGYWTMNDIDTANVQTIPIGRIFHFSFMLDSLGTEAYIDLPLWPYWGEIGSYSIVLTDTGEGFTTTDDSLYVLMELLVTSANGSTHQLLQIADSTENESVGIIYSMGIINGEVDISTEQDWWERLRLHAVQPITDASNNDTLGFHAIIRLPYSDKFIESSYFKEVREWKW